jgi:hypothetical protein
MKLFFDDADFDAQLQRTAAKAAYRACDFGEVFAIARRITPGDYDSWYREWFGAGEANHELAKAEAAKGHERNAGDAYLRASEYFRSAYFFSRRDLQSPRLLDAWRRCRDTFRAAAPWLPCATATVQIPYGDIHLEGYVVHPTVGGPGPTVLFPSGYDMPVEEFYTLGGYEAAARGFSVVAFSGPGQAEMLYERGIPFRHDFEAVAGPVIDFVESRADLDADRIAIVGRSFAGYLAPRAASKEHRIGALAADPAQTDMGTPLRARFPAEWVELLDKGDPVLNDEIWKVYPGVHGQEFWLSRAHAHGVSTPLEYAQEMQRWVVDVEAIECPTFVSYGEGDFAQVSTKDFYDRLSVDNKRYTMYKEADGGGGHCEGMGPSRYYTDLFGWLRELWPA